MHSSILSRSVIAVATLAVGSAALVATPATAATPPGVTRSDVLTAAAGVRATPAVINGSPVVNYGPTTNRALRAMVNRTCSIDPDGPEVSIGSISASTAGGGSADGVVVSAIVYNIDSTTQNGPSSGRVCSFGALATTAERSVLTGSASLTGGPTTALSGDVFVTPPVNSTLESLLGGGSDVYDALPTFSANGFAIQSNPTKVADKKSTKQKKAAKVKYDKRIASAKRAYKKALDKAGSSKRKKSAAKKAYSAKRSVAKAKYRTAIAGFKIITVRVPTAFSVSAKVSPPPSAP